MREKILQVLYQNKGRYVSGQQISRTLNISRTAVWKHINELQEKGCQIEAVAGKGYCLKNTEDLFFPGILKTSLETEYIGKNIFYFDEIPSTNKKARVLAERGEPEGTIVIAEKQNQGRGRLGRSWESPAKKGIWLSIILRPQISPPKAPAITLLTAVALNKAIRQSYDVDAKIKWPNDIYARGKKLAGILTEMKADMDMIEYVVVGAGLNANQKQEDFPPELRDRATSLRMVLNKKVERSRLTRSFLEEMEKLYELFLNGGFSRIREMWKEYNMTLNHEVSIHGLDKDYYGYARDITEDGALVVDTPEGIRVFHAGEVSLRKTTEQ